MPTFTMPSRQIVVLVVSILVAIGLIFIIMKLFSFYNNVKIKGGTTIPGAVKKTEKDTLTFVITGYGGPDHDGTYLTDTIILTHVNKKTKKVMLFSIPRDLWVKVPSSDPKDDHYSKINALYVQAMSPEIYPAIPDKYHGDQNAHKILKDTIEEITAVPVDYFIGIDFDGFEQVIDTLGGINITVKKTFDDYYYPIEGKEDDTCGREPKPTLTEDQEKEEKEKYEKMSEEEKKTYDERTPDQLNEKEFQELAKEKPEEAFPCRYEHLHFDAGPIKLDGETALKFARSRKSLEDGGDFNRAARQQLVIEAVKDKILSIGFIPKILPLMETLSNNIRTDIPLSEIQTLLGEARTANDYKISNYVLSTNEALDIDVSSDGQSILVSRDGEGNWGTVRKIVKNVINGITPTLTPSPTPKVSKTPAATKDTSTEE